MAELTREVDIDSMMGALPAAFKDVNFGAYIYIRHGVTYDGGTKSQWYRGIANFDVSDLAGAQINSAKLVREVWSLVNGGVLGKISRCTRPANWTEDGVTWNKYDGTSAWTAEGGDFDDGGPPAAITYSEPTSLGTHEITGLKDFVEDALDNRSGIVSIITRLALEVPGTTTRFVWWSKEHESDIWRLVIDYTLPNPGRRGKGASPFARGAPDLRPVTAARPTRAASGVAPARPRRPRRTA